MARKSGRGPKTQPTLSRRDRALAQAAAARRARRQWLLLGVGVVLLLVLLVVGLDAIIPEGHVPRARFHR